MNSGGKSPEIKGWSAWRTITEVPADLRPYVCKSCKVIKGREMTYRWQKDFDEDGKIDSFVAQKRELVLGRRNQISDEEISTPREVPINEAENAIDATFYTLNINNQAVNLGFDSKIGSPEFTYTFGQKDASKYLPKGILGSDGKRLNIGDHVKFGNESEGYIVSFELYINMQTREHSWTLKTSPYKSYAPPSSVTSIDPSQVKLF